MQFRIFCIAFLLASSCGKKPQPYTQTGEASYYADFFEGRVTSSGEPYRPDSFTAAHPFLPLGTEIKVINLSNQKETLVVVNDRGPYASHDRILDLSKAAADKLDFLEEGIADIKLIVQKPAEGYQINDSIASGRMDEYRRRHN